jgi:PilZ domain
MSAEPRPPTGPAEFDSVQIVDRLSGFRVSATVESANDRSFVLQLKHDAAMPEEAFLRWFDGASAWQGIALMERIDESRVRCELAPSDEWQAAPARSSSRVRVENSPLLVRILPGNRRMHAVCVDISESGCRANWLGKTPSVGDAVHITWDTEPSPAAPPCWIPARVVRIIPRPFGAHHICFSFEFADPKQAALVRERHQASLQDIRQRRRNERAA